MAGTPRAGSRHQLKDDRAVLDLTSKAADGRRENAPVIERHRLPRHEPRLGCLLWLALAQRLGDEPGLKQEFIAFQNTLIGPVSCLEPEGELNTLLAKRAEGFAPSLGPSLQP